ncbi:MAG: hypothetical protein LBB41_02360 [Prevotellaceae bacterium]|nr:hypothetical protein [Prevotellaceae bacterium]
MEYIIDIALTEPERTKSYTKPRYEMLMQGTGIPYHITAGRRQLEG